MTWTHIDGCRYKVLHDGEMVEMTSDVCHVLPEYITGEWQVIAVDEDGVEGFASEPLEIYPSAVSVPVDVKIDEAKGLQLSVSVEVPADGI